MLSCKQYIQRWPVCKLEMIKFILCELYLNNNNFQRLKKINERLRERDKLRNVWSTEGIRPLNPLVAQTQLHPYHSTFIAKPALC